MAYETAPFTTESADGKFSVRMYPALALAETDLVVPAQPEGAADADGSFMRLFRYIGGKNAREEKIAMTTPVFRDATRMSFVLPAEEGAAPAPSDPAVRLVTSEPMRVAVYRFSGRATEDNTTEARAKLLAWVRERGLTAEGEVFFAYYNSPMMPPPFRHNEALLRLGAEVK